MKNCSPASLATDIISCILFSHNVNNIIPMDGDEMKE